MRTTAVILAATFLAACGKNETTKAEQAKTASGPRPVLHYYKISPA